MSKTQSQEKMNLSEMNERQLLFERIKYQRGLSSFSNKEINDEAYTRMERLANE